MKEKKPVILVYSSQPIHPFWGGSEKYWYEAVLNPELRANFDFKIVLRESPVTRQRAETLQSSGIETCWLPDGKERTIEKLYHRLQHTFTNSKPQRQSLLSVYVQSIRPDLVWFNMASISHVIPHEQAFLTCSRLHIPYWLVFQHVQEHYFARNEEQTDRLRSLLVTAGRIVCVSERNRKTIERAVGERLINVWFGKNTINTETFNLLKEAGIRHPVREEGTARFLNLARFEPDNKGQHILLEALSDARWSHRDWHLVFQGDGRFKSLISRWITYFGIVPERVTIRDHSDDIASAYADSDLLILPSLSEGTPFALVEAMACGRPAVGTPVGGIPELIHEDATGWLAQSTEVAALSDALERAWSKRSSWPTIGASAREFITATYSYEGMIHDLIDALQEDVSQSATA